jgi:hypothetical protein
MRKEPSWTTGFAVGRARRQEVMGSVVVVPLHEVASRDPEVPSRARDGACWRHRRRHKSTEKRVGSGRKTSRRRGGPELKLYKQRGFRVTIFRRLFD